MGMKLRGGLCLRVWHGSKTREYGIYWNRLIFPLSRSEQSGAGFPNTATTTDNINNSSTDGNDDSSNDD